LNRVLAPEGDILSFASPKESIQRKGDPLHTWISKYSRPVENTKAVRTDDHLHEALRRLKKEVAQLTGERNLLKKAAAYPSASLRTGFAKVR